MVLMVFFSVIKHVEHLVMFVGSTCWLSVLFSVGLLEEEAHRIDKDNFVINTLENENKGLDSDSQVFCMEGSL